VYSILFTFFQLHRSGVFSLFTGHCPYIAPIYDHSMIIVGYGSTIMNGKNYDYWVMLYIFLSLT